MEEEEQKEKVIMSSIIFHVTLLHLCVCACVCHVSLPPFTPSLHPSNLALSRSLLQVLASIARSFACSNHHLPTLLSTHSLILTHSLTHPLLHAPVHSTQATESLTLPHAICTSYHARRSTSCG